MCHIHEAILDIAKTAESDVITIWVDDVEIHGTIVKCDCEEENCKCYEDILTLKDTCVHCKGTEEKREFKWLNIPTWGIKGFTFECCCTNE